MKVIGRKDRIDLPELGLYNIESKIDTGAYGCALHCHHIDILKTHEGQILSFKVLDPSHPEYADKIFTAKNFNEKVVKNSSGQVERRFTIQTEMILFNTSNVIEFSLTDRKEMKYPVLLGRKFLSKRFIVDVGKKDVSYHLKLNNQ